MLKNQELWKKIRDLIKPATNNSDNYNKKYMKINFNSDDDSTVKKTREIYDMIIDVTSVFHEDNKYFPQFF